MARPLFNRIVTAVTNYDSFFHNNTDCTEKEGISPLIKCTSAIRQMAYDVNGNFLDEYMQISEKSSHMALDHFCEAVMEIYGPEFLRKPMVIDNEKLYRHHEEKHGFSGMLIVRIESGLVVLTRLKGNMLDAIMRFLLWLTASIPHPDIILLTRYIRNWRHSLRRYDDHKRILYKQKHESARKDVERAFSVLKKKWAILANPTRAQRKEKRFVNMIYTCIILHNMIRKYKKVTISPKWFPEEAHQPEDLLQNEEQMERVMRWIGSLQAHQNLRYDLIEHLSRNV
uniref:Protein ALP1-like n=1 Tax=Tanacetum cinerariifolium TaxID=118510 RepID=A0A6L2NEK3_TANCI|nr:hypothetical protein [Tanacetum cinerariifolium]